MALEDSREEIANCRSKGRSIKVERVRRYRAGWGWEIVYEIFVDGRKTQENCKADQLVAYFMNALEDNS